jgi:hypothetical protein
LGQGEAQVQFGVRQVSGHVCLFDRADISVPELFCQTILQCPVHSLNSAFGLRTIGMCVIDIELQIYR